MPYVVNAAEPRVIEPTEPNKPVTRTVAYPIVFEDPEHGIARSPFADSREDAGKIADELNAVLSAHGLLTAPAADPKS